MARLPPRQTSSAVTARTRFTAAHLPSSLPMSILICFMSSSALLTPSKISSCFSCSSCKMSGEPHMSYPSAHVNAQSGDTCRREVCCWRLSAPHTAEQGHQGQGATGRSAPVFPVVHEAGGSPPSRPGGARAVVGCSLPGAHLHHSLGPPQLGLRVGQGRHAPSLASSLLFLLEERRPLLLVLRAPLYLQICPPNHTTGSTHRGHLITRANRCMCTLLPDPETTLCRSGSMQPTSSDITQGYLTASSPGLTLSSLVRDTHKDHPASLADIRSSRDSL
jgi:hypothetical protein